MTNTYLANAKINLFLDITGVRADGYHLLETSMQSVDLSDIVEISKTEHGISVVCSDPEIPSGEGNICCKAAREFMDLSGVSFGVRIRIEKRIPHGAGMGGGSADAAAVLKGMNELSGEPLGSDELFALAAKIGADVPFCLAGGAKLCRGIGDIMEDKRLCSAENYLVVKPDYSTNTKQAFADYDKSPVPRKEKAEPFYNVFEELFKDPETTRIKRLLTENGALGACLTGSGSAVVGAFSDEETARGCAKKFPQYFTAVCHPAKSGVIRIE